MKKKLILGAATASAALLGTAAVVSAHGGPRADSNGDGNISRAEFEASVEERFSRLDANSDGQIDQSEREARRHGRRGSRGERRGRRGGHHGRRGGRAMHRDMDGDGQFTRADIDARHQRALERFEAADSNNDGRIDDSEREAMRAERRERRAERRQARWAETDTNGDGVVSRAEFTAKAVERFSSADTNNDGVVSIEERRAAHAARRANRGG